MQGLSCFWTILSALPYTCLVLLALFCFACFLGVNRFLVGIIFILVKYLSFFAFRILYRTISYPYHIIYLASISSYVFLFLCLKEMLCIRLFAPFISLYGNFWLWNPLKIRILRLVSIDVYLHLALKYMKLARLDNHIFV